MQKQYVLLSGLFIMLSILLGAMGAHALKKILEPELFNSFEVGVRYQGFLSMGIFVLALNTDRFNFPMNRLLAAMTIGMLLFCLSIYALIALNVWQLPKGIIVALTPIGGSLTIITWFIFLYRLIKN